MAIKIGIMGAPNTGKSYSRSFLENPEEVVILASSAKATYLKDNKGKPLQKMPSMAEMKELVQNKEHIPGNWAIMPDIRSVESNLKVISNYMPYIKTVIIPDFTHYISKILASDSFMKANSGGGAFARFWDLAASSLNAFFLASDSLRDDLIIVLEFHAEYNDTEEVFQIFVPGGKMLSEKFKPESYFDIMLCTYIQKDEAGNINPDSYKFITRKYSHYNARSMEILKDTLIPNNLQTVITAVREYFHI